MVRTRRIAAPLLTLVATGASAAAAPVASEIAASGPDAPLSDTFLDAAAKDAPVIIILPGSGPTDRDGMTHTLKHVDSDETAANMATYTDPDLPVAPALVDAVAAFIKSR